MDAAAFWDRAAEAYARRRISDPGAYEAALARVKSRLRPEDRVLELGCGTGSTALRLAPCVATYVGNDLSGAMIAIAEEKRRTAAQGNLSFRQAGVARAAAPGEDVDAVLAFNLLHLLPDLAKGLGSMRDVLRPGGVFISKTPAIGEKWRYRPVVAAMRALGKLPAMSLLKVAQIDRAIAEAGFEILETDLLPPSLPSRFVVARKR